jgi:uncharacterized protein
MKTKPLHSTSETHKQPFVPGKNYCRGNKIQTVLITGAKSGIGASFARCYASKGYNLIMTGRRLEKLTTIANQLRQQYNIEIETACTELSTDHNMNLLLSTICHYDNIYVTVNNAAFGSGKYFYENEIDGHLQMLNVHVVARFKLIHAIISQMLARHQGAIINVSSLAAYTPAPGSCTYSATKMFLLNFSESLAMELKNSGITVKCLCPGFPRNELHGKLLSDPIHCKRKLTSWMDADSIVKKCQRSLSNSKIIYMPGIFNRLLVWIISIISRMTYYRLVRKLNA